MLISLESLGAMSKSDLVLNESIAIIFENENISFD